jgi:hypothetical protein
MTPEEKREIIETYKWIKVKIYQPDDSKCWEERYREERTASFGGN